jgi:hypothetical protein
MQDKFIIFIESLRNESNDFLINTIIEGYAIAFEALSTDDANNKPNGQTISHIKPASIVNYLQNADNEYFPQTISDKAQTRANKALMGNRVAQLPAAGRTSLGKDSMSKYQSTYNVNGVGGEYAGGGTGGLK